MIKTIAAVEGMACPMCEKHMNEAVIKTFDVESVTSSHTDKLTVIVAKETVDEQKLREAADSVGYKVLSVKYEELA